jgi:endonuclease/exonuclease/phosphatase family metal-dependent hydrolase
MAEPGAKGLRVATYNVHRCVGLDWRRSETRIADVIASVSADIVGLQELSLRRTHAGSLDQAAVIAQQLGWNVVFQPAFSNAHEDFGDALISRFPLRLVRAAELPGESPWYCREPRWVLWAEAQTHVGAVQIMNTHLGLGRTERLHQAQWLASEVSLGSMSRQTPLILLGDLNFSPGSHPHRHLTSSLRDVRQVTAKPLRTFPTWLPLFAVDHILVGEHFSVTGVRVHRRWPARMASDHFPLVADLTRVAA